MAFLIYPMELSIPVNELIIDVGASKVCFVFICSRCRKMMQGIVNLIEKLCDKVEKVNGFCYLGNKLNVRGHRKVAITARVRIGMTQKPFQKHINTNATVIVGT